jgi:propanediol dehydratase small subunit
MKSNVQQNAPVPKLALNRVEAAEALGLSPAPVDRLTIRGLLRPSRATRRPMYSVKELERFLKETTAADYEIPRVL